MNVEIRKFRDIVTSGQHFDRVKISGEDVVKGTKPWVFNSISKAVGIFTGQRQKENQQAYDSFKNALRDAYGEAGIASLTAHRPETDSRRRLSTDLIESVIAQAEIDVRKGQVTRGPAPAVSTREQYEKLPALDFLSGGQIMIKKAFALHGSAGEKAIEFGITRGQKLWTKLPGWVPRGDKETNISAEIDGRQQRMRTRFLGDSSSEHAGIALDSTHIGEAVNGGLRKNDTTGNALKDTQYVVYEPRPELRLKMLEIAGKFLEKPGEMGDGNYDAGNAFTSLFKPRINSQYAHDWKGDVKFDESGKAITREGGATTLAAARAYLNGASDVRPDVFCSEFAALCLELAMEDLYGQSASGLDPNAVSPMHLEDLVNSRPDLFSVAGRYEGKNAKEAPPSFDQQEIGLRAHTGTLERDQQAADSKLSDLKDAIRGTGRLIDDQREHIQKVKKSIAPLAARKKALSALPVASRDVGFQREVRMINAKLRLKLDDAYKSQQRIKVMAAALTTQMDTLREFEARETAEYEKLSKELGISEIPEGPAELPRDPSLSVDEEWNRLLEDSGDQWLKDILASGDIPLSPAGLAADEDIESGPSSKGNPSVAENKPNPMY